jgi:hypothetical protein
MTPRVKRELTRESFIGYAEKLYTRPVIPGEARGVTLQRAQLGVLLSIAKSLEVIAGRVQGGTDAD